MNALLQIQQGIEQLRTAAPSLVNNLGLGVAAAGAQPPTTTATTTPTTPSGQTNTPPRQQQNSELFTQVCCLTLMSTSKF